MFHLTNALHDVVNSPVSTLLQGSLLEDLRVPPKAKLLESGNINYPLVQVIEQQGHVLLNEQPVIVNGIAGKRGLLVANIVLLQEGKNLLLSHLQGYFR